MYTQDFSKRTSSKAGQMISEYITLLLSNSLHLNVGLRCWWKLQMWCAVACVITRGVLHLGRGWHFTSKSAVKMTSETDSSFYCAWAFRMHIHLFAFSKKRGKEQNRKRTKEKTQKKQCTWLDTKTNSSQMCFKGSDFFFLNWCGQQNHRGTEVNEFTI